MVNVICMGRPSLAGIMYYILPECLVLFFACYCVIYFHFMILIGGKKYSYLYDEMSSTAFEGLVTSDNWILIVVLYKHLGTLSKCLRIDPSGVVRIGYGFIWLCYS